MNLPTKEDWEGLTSHLDILGRVQLAATIRAIAKGDLVVCDLVVCVKSGLYDDFAYVPATEIPNAGGQTDG